MKTLCKVYGLSDKGIFRQTNEDFYGYYISSFGTLLIVSDGMGGHRGGATASRLVVKTIKEHFEKLPTDYNPIEELKDAFISANNVINEESIKNYYLSEMGATACVVLVYNDNVYVGSLGDSRVYGYKDNKLTLITNDHSYVQQLYNDGVISLDEIKDHPQKHIITKSLGAGIFAEPDVFSFAISKYDRYLVCTDGLTNYVDDKELEKYLADYSIKKICQQLVLLVKKRNGRDNITLQILELDNRINKIVKKIRPSRKFKIIMSLSIIFIFLFAITFGESLNIFRFLLGEDSSNSMKLGKGTIQPKNIHKEVQSTISQGDFVEFNDSLAAKQKKSLDSVKNMLE